MELKHYFKFFARYAWLILGIGVLTAFVSVVAVTAQPDKHQQNSSLLLSLRDGKTLTDYDYDQFYTLQAADLYASNIVSWMNSVEVNESIRQQAASPDGRIRGKRTGGTIELTATAPDPTQASALISAATALITDRTKTLAAGENRSSFEVVARPLGNELVESNAVQAGLAGLLAGLLFGVAAGLLWQAVRPKA